MDKDERAGRKYSEFVMSYVLVVLATLAYVGIGAAFAMNIAIDTFSAGLIFLFWPVLSPLLIAILFG